MLAERPFEERLCRGLAKAFDCEVSITERMGEWLVVARRGEKAITHTIRTRNEHETVLELVDVIRKRLGDSQAVQQRTARKFEFD